MSRNPIIAVVGSGGETEPAISNARELGRSIAENGWTLITGGRDAGVMRAANQGARDAGGLTVGILPNRETEASPELDVAIITDVGEARNNIVVLSADVVVACGVDDPGTASEVALALKARKPVILLSATDKVVEFFKMIGGVHLAQTASEAVRRIEAIRAE